MSTRFPCAPDGAPLTGATLAADGPAAVPIEAHLPHEHGADELAHAHEPAREATPVAPASPAPRPARP